MSDRPKEMWRCPNDCSEFIYKVETCTECGKFMEHWAIVDDWDDMPKNVNELREGVVKIPNVRQLAEKKDDNTTVRPVELLRLALADAEKDDTINAAIVLLIHRRGDKAGEADTFRCGLPWEAEVAALSWAWHKAVGRE